MVPTQEEQLDALLNQSTKVLNKIQEAEETDALMTLRRDNRSSSFLDHQDIKTTIVMTGR